MDADHICKNEAENIPAHILKKIKEVMEL